MKRNRFSWTGIRLDLKLTGWIPAAGSALALLLFFGLFEHLMTLGGEIDWSYPRRAVEVIVPLAFALHAAFAFNPDSEPALEVLLACPQPAHRLLGDRLLLSATLHALIALTATLAFVIIWETDTLGLALVRWVAASSLLAGIAVFTTQVTRQGVFGTLTAVLVWASSLYGGDGLLRRWPWAWPVHICLQPEGVAPTTYLLNRLILLTAGLGLFFLAARLCRDEERLLGIR